MIRAVIVEDEPKNAIVLTQLLTDHCPEVVVQGVEGDCLKAYTLINEIRPELIFLDIEIQRGTGFDLLDQLQPIGFEVIFITAFHHYAIQAFKYNSIDYLLKPIDEDELVQAVERAQNRIRNRVVNENLLAFLKTLASPSPLSPARPAKVGFPTLEGYVFLFPHQIIRCEASGAYTFIYCTGNEKLVISKSLKEIESLLDQNVFCRVHHSQLINLSFVKKYHRGKGGYLELEDGTYVEVSARKKNDFLERCKLISSKD
ncbi:MAG: LytTR family DNA-binding domain-containing protein [Bacteroidota bacterium]